MLYNYQQADWPNFTFDLHSVEQAAIQYLQKTAHLNGMLSALPATLRSEAIVDFMTVEALTTSAIEGEFIDREDVKSSIRNQLGLNAVPEPVHDVRARGLGQMMASVRQTFAEPLTQEQLFEWHRSLLGYRDDIPTLGTWRTHLEPMQVVSGPMGKQQIHFEAPPSSDVPAMMNDFMVWFNQSFHSKKSNILLPPVRAALAHLWFETIHPFEDGNGRIGRAVAEKSLSQDLGAPIPFSLSRAIEANKKAYYRALEAAQRSNIVTEWLEYFIPMTLQALETAEELVVFLVKKAHFFDRFREKLNERQLKAIRRMFDAGPAGFKGGMDARKYCGITGASKATATRDLQQLSLMGALIVAGAGRSTKYQPAL